MSSSRAPSTGRPTTCASAGAADRRPAEVSAGAEADLLGDLEQRTSAPRAVHGLAVARPGSYQLFARVGTLISTTRPASRSPADSPARPAGFAILDG